VLAEVNAVRRKIQPTPALRSDFSSLRIAGAIVPNFEELTKRYPRLLKEKQMMAYVADYFYDPDLFDKVSPVPAWQFIQGVFTEENRNPAGKVPVAVQQAREALGPYAWILDETQEPVQIIYRLAGNQAHEEFLRVASMLAAANSHLDFALIAEGSPEVSRRYSTQLAALARRLKLPAGPLDRFRFVSSTGTPQDIIRAIKQIRTGDKEKYSAVLESSPDILERVGYIPRLTRVSHHDLSRETAVMVTAALLRQLADQYDIVKLEDLVGKFNINVQELTQYVAKMIQVLNHLATQA
jgi:hypothetical protein